MTRNPMICSSLNRFFPSNLLGVGDWTPNRPATQNPEDVAGKATIMVPIPASWVGSRGREAVPDIGGQAFGFRAPDVKVAEDRSIEPEKPNAWIRG